MRCNCTKAAKAKVVGSKFDRTRSPARAKQTKTKNVTRIPNLLRQFRRNLAKSSRLLVHFCSIFRAISPSVKRKVFVCVRLAAASCCARDQCSSACSYISPHSPLRLRLRLPTPTARNSPPSPPMKCSVLVAVYGHEEIIEPNQGWISVYVSPFFSFLLYIRSIHK